LSANRMKPSLIRIYADESTYNLHIIIRYKLEKALMEDRITVEELPEAWAQYYEEIVGVRPPNYSQGVLQDIHWSLGLFGYFPSYTLGNLYASSFRFAIEEAHPDCWKQVRTGEFGVILSWLRENIHSKGNIQSQEEIVFDAVGERNHVSDLIKHLKQRQEVVKNLKSPVKD